MVTISEFLSLDRIRIFSVHDKDEALKELLSLLSSADAIGDAGELERAIFERESLMSTSIGLGIAIPHVRLESVSEMCMAIGVLKEGIDYQAFDDQQVRIIIMIAAPAGTHRQYLSLLAKLVLLLKNPAIRDAILTAQDPKQVFDILREH